MKLISLVCVSLALAGCNSSKQAYLSGCRAGIYKALESFGYAAENVNSGKVDEACQELEGSKKTK